MDLGGNFQNTFSRELPETPGKLLSGRFGELPESVQGRMYCENFLSKISKSIKDILSIFANCFPILVLPAHIYPIKNIFIYIIIPYSYTIVYDIVATFIFFYLYIIHNLLSVFSHWVFPLFGC